MLEVEGRSRGNQALPAALNSVLIGNRLGLECPNASFPLSRVASGLTNRREDAVWT